MANKELLDFVQQSLARGESREQITTALAQQGWQADQISEVFSIGKPVRSRKSLYAGIVILILLLIGGGVFAYYHKKSEGPSISKENTQVYFFGGSKELGNFQFSFRYPKDYCTSQDIGTVTVLYKNDCTKTYGQKIDSQMSITTFPDTNNKSRTTDEYVTSLTSTGNVIDTGNRRMIAGYTAHQLKDQKANLYAWVFLTNYQWDPNLPDLPGESGNKSINKYYWGVIIGTKLEGQPGGAEAQETVLNSFAIGNKAETPAPLSKEEQDRQEKALRDAERIIDVRKIRGALGLYDSDNKKFPNTLDELVPKYLDMMLLDPLDHKPYGYAVNPDALTSKPNEGKSTPYQVWAILETDTAVLRQDGDYNFTSHGGVDGKLEACTNGSRDVTTADCNYDIGIGP